MESVVALLIVMGAFTVAMIVFLNVINSDRTPTKIKARLYGAQMAAETRETGIYLNDEKTTANLKIEKNIQTIPEKPGLLLMTIRSSNRAGDLLTEEKSYWLEKEKNP